MASDSPQSAVADSPPSGQSPVVDKVRIRFRKGDDLRLLSHHDLQRAFQRMLRRAVLPVRHSKGFNPHPRLIFALSLPLGVIGCEEVVELELNEVLELNELRDLLVRQAPPGLEILSLRRIGPRDGAQVRRLTYRLTIPTERLADLRPRIAGLLAQSECWFERTRPPVRRVNVRSYLIDLRLIELPPHPRPLSPERRGELIGHALEMELCLTQSGTARPEEVLTLLGLQDLVEAGAVLERSRLELDDELPPPDLNQIPVCGFAEETASRQGNPSTAEGIA